MKQSLNGTWSLKGFKPDCAQPALTLGAMVPGNVELDLSRAGIEPDPFFAANEYLYRKYETWDWELERTFSLDEHPDADVFLVFEGLNCISDILIDGNTAGHFENALIPARLDINALAPGQHTLCVRIHSALKSAMERDYPVAGRGPEGAEEATRLRMPAHSFGWDIMPRFLSAGMYRDVYVEILPRVRFTQVYFATRRANEHSAEVAYKFSFTTPDNDPARYSVRVLLDGQQVSLHHARFVSGGDSFTVNAPKLWWPRGYGRAELYDITFELYCDDVFQDSVTQKLGIRQIEIAHKMAPGDEGEFLVRVNGERVFLNGSNWVPLDAFHSRDSKRLERAVQLFSDSNCNILRLWGGNVYESQRLFELCDEYGILVWHDFAMACAIYPQDDAFADVIEQEAAQVIRSVRNHPCLLLWSGDNEVDECYLWRGYTPEGNRYNRITREILPRAVRQNDPYRMFLPSSPFIDGGVKRYQVPEQHLWGARAWYKDDFYKNTSAHFVSECGYHGCPAPESLRRFIPEQELNDPASPSWIAHSSEYEPLYKRGYQRNQLMLDQVKLMFGCVPEKLEDMAFLSQFVQAEAYKYFIESARARAFRRTGIIWWNMLDGWPQISDAVVDWYFVKKRAYKAICRAQEPVLVLLDEPSGWEQDVLISNNSLKDVRVQLRLWDADTNDTLLEGAFSCKANSVQRCASLRVFSSQKRLILIEYDHGEGKKRSHYLAGFPTYSMEQAKRWAAYIDEEAVQKQ